jgi:hypothetical protein
MFYTESPKRPIDANRLPKRIRINIITKKAKKIIKAIIYRITIIMV